MLDKILAIIGGALALLFGTGWAKENWRRRQVEEELSQRRLASAKRQEAATKAALKIKDDLAKQQPPIDTKGRSDFK
jgi:predicted nuclease of restriction endonuclease-like (RecB) superfamily